MKTRRTSLASVISLTLTLSAYSAASHAWVSDPRIAPELPLSFSSDNSELNLALNRSLDYAYSSLVVGPQQYPTTEDERRIVMFRDAGYPAIASYWGSYHGTPNANASGYREAFCLRDVAHQTDGAALLSLNEENLRMLTQFAADALKDTRIDVNAGDFDVNDPEASARVKSFWQKYWTLWSYNFYGFPYYMDAGFQELPAPYELLEKVYAMYLYSGDERWLSDTFLDYGRMLHNQFTKVYDFNGNGIADNRGKGGILPTLWEFEGAGHIAEEFLSYDNSSSPATLVINKGYFEQLSVQDLTLKVRLKNGKDDYLNVRVNNLTNSDGTKPRVSRDFILVNTRYAIEDQLVTLELPQGVTLTGISDGSDVLTAGTDYVINGDQVTLKSDYLNGIRNQKSGEIKSAFMFDFSDGQRTQTVVQLTYRNMPPVLDKHDVTLDWGAMENITLKLDLDGMNGDTSLYRIENSMTRVVEAGDTLGVQYQSLLAMEGLLKAKAALLSGSEKQALSGEASEYKTKADALLSDFRSRWYDSSKQTYARAFDGYGRPVFGWGHENSFFMPMKDLLEPGTKADSYLAFIHQNATDKWLNEEAITYLPEAFYNYGKNDQGWYWLQQGTKRFYSDRTDEQVQRTYPEIAFTNVSNVVTHMMGYQPRADINRVDTLSRLPAELGHIQVANLPVGQALMDTSDYRRDSTQWVTLKHTAQQTTELTNQSQSKQSLTWRAQFEGDYAQLYVDGQAQASHSVSVNGVSLSYVDVSVAPGEHKKVTVTAPPAKIALSDLTPASASTDWGSVKMNTSTDGNPLRIGGQTYASGIGTHANSEIVYQLSGQYDSFTASVGVDDEVGDYGSVVFEVLADGNSVYRSPVVRGSDGAQQLSVDLNGVNELRLVVSDAGDGINHDHANWADAWLTRN